LFFKSEMCVCLCVSKKCIYMQLMKGDKE